jgi:hypothetical protein
MQGGGGYWAFACHIALGLSGHCGPALITTFSCLIRAGGLRELASPEL